MITDNVELTQEDINRTSRTMSHWLNVAKMLYDSEDEAFILKLLKVELETRDRYYIVQRIYAHYNSTRRRRELKELQSWNPKRRRKSTSDSISET